MDLLLYADTYLSRLRSDQLFNYAVKALTNPHNSDIADSMRMFEKEFALLSKILQLRASIQKCIVELEHYIEFRNDVIRTYSAKFRIGPKDRPRLRICRNYGNTSVCISTKNTTYWLGDQAIYIQFTAYLQLKRNLMKDMKRYRVLLEQASKSEYSWVRKLSRYLSRELKLYTSTVRRMCRIQW